MCGGFAAIPCPEGQTCLITASYPDASGYCVGPERRNCAAVTCLAVECAAGEHAYVPPGECCAICVPDNP